ncbi:MAG TPA: 4'-phosphopantetheinyl transferase superfamily protein, partial [Solirubrobacteraceae bacterium]|nr:4'-phosphopantetheinyl transferase superfamily protein [Solirubrobacteraceae bacterium]
LMRLTGWEDKRFDVPDRFRPLTVPAELTPLSAPWDAPAATQAALGAACRRLDARIPADGALWKGVWARRVLGRRERAHFDELRMPESRQLEWLGARTAAKEAVATLLRARHGVDLLPADVEIVPDERGAPVVVAAGTQALDVVPVVSLAHAGGESVALAALVPAGSGVRLGIDVERIRSRPPGFEQAALTAPERAVLDRVPAAAREEWVLRCWCVKEAAGKAVGSGIAPGPNAPVVLAVDPEAGEAVVAVGDRRLRVHSGRDAELVYATTVWHDDGGPDEP